MITLEQIGAFCRVTREKLGYLQRDVAQEVGCSKENISAFETGRNNNALILFWYVEHGLMLIKDTEAKHNDD